MTFLNRDQLSHFGNVCKIIVSLLSYILSSFRLVIFDNYLCRHFFLYLIVVKVTNYTGT